MILVNILPINSNPADTNGTFNINNANRICIPNPFITNDQLIFFRFLLKKKAISNSEIIPKNPLEIEVTLIADVAIAFGGVIVFLKA